MALILNALSVAIFLLPITEGSVQFTPGFPMAVPYTGFAVIHARAKVDDGYTIHGARVRYWEGGGVLNTQMVPIGLKGELAPIVISGLKPGVAYFVTLEVMQSRAGQNGTLSSDPVRLTGR